MFKLSFGAILLATALSDKVYFVDNDDVDRTGKITLYNLDTATKVVNEVTSWQDDHFTFGATVCKNSYYGYWADIVSQTFGLVGVDLATKNVTVYNTDVLYHAVACNPTNNGQLYGVGSTPSPSGAVFTFQTFDLTNNVDKQGPTLPAVGFTGYDTVFTFTQDGTKLYGAGTTPAAIEKSYQYIFDIPSQKVTYGPVQYPLGQTPVTVFPDASPVTGWVNTQFGHQFSAFDFGTKITVKHKSNVDKYWSPHPVPICGDIFYASSNNPNPKWTIWGLSTATGKEVFSLDLDVPATQGYFLGGLACVSS